MQHGEGSVLDVIITIFLAAVCLAVAYGGWRLFKYDRLPSIIRKPVGGILLGLGVLFALAFVAVGLTYQTPEEREAAMAKVEKEQAEKAALEKAKAAEEEAARIERDRKAELAAAERKRARDEKRRTGLHCLSAWDGSNRSAVRLMKNQYLRDPDSFDHIETRILPLDEGTGEHGAWMRYRARNGFGGMNVEDIYLRIDSETCSATLFPDGPGS
ncbi:MAG: hypothetical protein CL950_10445 [Erythrobacter sp.]|nr:hypothetical protein [Erythrobacter sp.]|tara:strand:- start:2536 stop:3177 length:642 start_codon:yes stop_codon:yes gene_type:complete